MKTHPAQHPSTSTLRSDELEYFRRGNLPATFMSDAPLRRLGWQLSAFDHMQAERARQRLADPGKTTHEAASGRTQCTSRSIHTGKHTQTQNARTHTRTHRVAILSSRLSCVQVVGHHEQLERHFWCHPELRNRHARIRVLHLCAGTHPARCRVRPPNTLLELRPTPPPPPPPPTARVCTLWCMYSIAFSSMTAGMSGKRHSPLLSMKGPGARVRSDR